MNNDGESIGEHPTQETILPIIVPSFDESSSRVIETNEPSISTTTVAEDEQQQQSQETTDQSSSTTQSETQASSTTNNSEYINPRGIRFTSTPTTPAAGGPAKGSRI